MNAMQLAINTAAPGRFNQILTMLPKDTILTGGTEFQPVHVAYVEDGINYIERCEPEEAEAWGVYVETLDFYRGRAYREVAWVADFSTEKEAVELSAELKWHLSLKMTVVPS